MRTRLALVRRVPLGILGLLVACEAADPSPTPPPETASPLPAPPPACPPPMHGPTIHEGDVAPNETWAADTSPHIVKRNVNVRNGAILTIEPCAELRIAKGQTIQVAYPITPNTGTLIAEGKADRPIRISGVDGERWGHVAVRAPGSARFAHVSFEDGGGGDAEGGATLLALGDGADEPDPILFVDHVRVARSLGAGLRLRRGAVFVSESRELVVERSGSAEAPRPLEIEEQAFDTLPTGRYTGNFTDEILVDPSSGTAAGSGLSQDGTLHDRGVPYRIGRSNGDSLRIGGRADGRLVTLTIEPGVVMRFGKGSALEVQHFTTTKPSTAALRALGTEDKPIVMTSAEPIPAAGDWRGVWFGGIPSDKNVIDHVRIEHAGGDCGCTLRTCSAIEKHAAAVIFTAPPPSAFVTNTVFVESAGHGITQGFDGSFVDFRPTNRFESVRGCDQTRPRELPQCPVPRPNCE